MAFYHESELLTGDVCAAEYQRHSQRTSTFQNMLGRTKFVVHFHLGQIQGPWMDLVPYTQFLFHDFTMHIYCWYAGIMFLCTVK